MQPRLWYQIDKATLIPTIHIFVGAKTVESIKLTPLVQNSDKPRYKTRIRLLLKIKDLELRCNLPQELHET